MSQKDESAPGGLLSRVVRFVKNPTTNWGDLEQEADRESSYSKQMLKEMIERKRRNDFVRKREFDMLRKMRRSEVLAGQDPGLRPSFFQSSMPSKPAARTTVAARYGLHEPSTVRSSIRPGPGMRSICVRLL